MIESQELTQQESISVHLFHKCYPKETGEPNGLTNMIVSDSDTLSINSLMALSGGVRNWVIHTNNSDDNLIRFIKTDGNMLLVACNVAFTSEDKEVRNELSKLSTRARKSNVIYIN